MVLPSLRIGISCARHRVFLAVLIVAAKYLNDASPKNVHWANYAVIFKLADINLMELQLLRILDFDLRFDEAEAIKYFHLLFPPNQPSTRGPGAQRVYRAGKARVQAQTKAHLPTPLDDEPLAISTAITHAVRGIVKRISAAQLSGPHSSRSTTLNGSSNLMCNGTDSSSSTSSSDTASLMDEIGSSSSASSPGWLSTDSEDKVAMEAEKTKLIKDFHQEDGNVSVGLTPRKRPFMLRSVPAHAYRYNLRRKASDSSSVDTLRVLNSPRSRNGDVAQRSNSMTLSKRAARVESGMAASATMPNFSRSGGVTKGFLGRMWDAATKATIPNSGGEKCAHDNRRGFDGDLTPEQTPNVFRRLVRTRSGGMRTTSMA